MTLSPWIIYLWGIADSVKHASEVLFFFPVIMCTVCLLVLMFVDGDDSTLKAAWKGLKRAAPVTIFIGFFATFLPSSKTIAVMVVAPAIVNSDPIQKDLPELYKAAKDALMGTLKDAK